MFAHSHQQGLDNIWNMTLCLVLDPLVILVLWLVRVTTFSWLACGRGLMWWGSTRQQRLITCLWEAWDQRQKMLFNWSSIYIITLTDRIVSVHYNICSTYNLTIAEIILLRTYKGKKQHNYIIIIIIIW